MANDFRQGLSVQQLRFRQGLRRWRTATRSVAQTHLNVRRFWSVRRGVTDQRQFCNAAALRSYANVNGCEQKRVILVYEYIIVLFSHLPTARDELLFAADSKFKQCDLQRDFKFKFVVGYWSRPSREWNSEFISFRSAAPIPNTRCTGRTGLYVIK